MQNFDPLSDSAPPRYAIESDEEEDEYNPLNPKNSNPNDCPSALPAIIIQGNNIPNRKELIIATGDAGKYWAKGSRLGEQTGSVQVNGVEVGLVFHPTWTNAVIIISEVLVRLPAWAQHVYALTIVEHLRPTRLALLDTYSIPTYISTEPVAFHDAPVRYIATKAEFDSKLRAEVESFTPPNLIQSTSASFMSVISTSNAAEGTLVLLPSNCILRSPPRKILLADLSLLQHNSVHWSPTMMMKTQRLLSASLGEERYPEWLLNDEGNIDGFKNKSKAPSTGMYI